ncbi:MAG: hypothetical protein LAO09_09200 [Acidobacteriia bacterium]|nr:hypothetical protein [Terriglobia bacterium]
MAEFDGIEEKLIRANQNIRNLDVEISRFFQKSKYPVLPEHDRELLLEAIQYHKQLAIPLRFSVLSGEIIHHLRSCLDHLIWQFSTPESRLKHFIEIEFPIFNHEPIKEKQIARYEGKIQGITDPRGRDLIKRLQPYNSPDFVDYSLSILHHMDIVDKHRELVLTHGTGSRMFPAAMRPIVESYQRAHPEITPAEIAVKFKPYGQLVPQISFTDFGRREIEPVAQGLVELYNSVVKVVGQFRELG